MNVDNRERGVGPIKGWVEHPGWALLHDGVAHPLMALTLYAQWAIRFHQWTDEPEWLKKHPRYGYLRQAYLSVLPWVDRTDLRWLHWCKCAWSAATGIEHVLDHRIPLNHKRVCGLTVPWNLRLVPRPVNDFKAGHWCDGQEELFIDDEATPCK